MNHYISVLIYYILSGESLCVVNSLQSSKTLRNQTPYPFGSVGRGIPKRSVSAFSRSQCFREAKLQSSKLPFVRIHSGNNSNKNISLYLYLLGNKNYFQHYFICYVAPLKLQRTTVSVSATKYYFQNNFRLYLYLL